MTFLGLPRRLAVGVVVVVAAAALAGVASANNRPAITFVSPPSPTEGQTLTTDSVQFQFTYNRQPKATASLECDLAGPTSSSGPCDTPVSSAKQQSSSGASYSNLANGDYTFTVTLTLTDGGTATAVRHFTVNACTAGSENFSGFNPGDQPTTFAGGTIDTAYGSIGGVYSPIGGFSGNSLFSGIGVNSFQLTFTKSVGSVQLDAESNYFGADTNLTLTGYNAANAVVDTDTAVDPAFQEVTRHLSISSASNNIKYFTIATDDPTNQGVFFSNIVWGCN